MTLPLLLFPSRWSVSPSSPSELAFRALAMAGGFGRDHLCRGGSCGTRAFHESEIKLTGNQIGLYHFHEHLITELVHFPVVAAHDAVILLVELVIISFQLIDGNEAFAFRVIQFHVKAPLRHAGNRSHEILSEFVAHELDLLVLDGGPFRVRGDLFHVGAMLAHLFILLGIGRASTVEITLQQAVGHHVRVPTDRRREV